MIRVELYDVARLRAGTDVVEVEAATLREALVALTARHPQLDPEIVRDGALTAHWRASLDGRRFLSDPDTPLPDGAAVLILSALAGG